MHMYIILVLMIWFCLVLYHFEAMSFSPFSGLSRHRENREFESAYFRTGKNRELAKNIKNMFIYREFTNNTGEM